MARMSFDIHDYERKYEYAQRQVQQSEISARNKELIFGYRDACLLRNTAGKVRLIRIFGVLLLFARLLKKDFDRLSKQDVESLVGQLLSRKPAYSPETLGTYKAMLKNFVTWVLVPDRYPTTTNLPEQVSWITSHVKRRDKKRLERNELLTPDDIQKLIETCRNPRDKALIAMLWEMGARIAELGNPQLKHVTKVEHGYVVDLKGKTGQRSVLIVSSAPYLTQWLNSHPFKNDPESPLWVHYQYETTPQHLKYDSIRYFLARTFTRAGITKRFYPHLFRHSRATYVLANGIMNEQQAKTYFGWTPSSNMLATYSHLTVADANEAVLRENQLVTTTPKQEELKPRQCPICNDLNTPTSDYCNRCGAVLDLKRAYQEQTAHHKKDEVVLQLFKLLVERGLVDEAAKQVHESGLATTLREIVLHAQTTPRLTAPNPPPTPSPP